MEEQPTHGQILNAVNDLKTKLEVGCKNMERIETELKASGVVQSTLAGEITQLKISIALTRGGMIAAAFIVTLTATIVGIVVAGLSAQNQQQPPAQTSSIQRPG